MQYNELDKMIEYIEENLTEKITILKLSKIVGLPPYILQRVFEFITGTTITEYIRKRRLSKAYESLCTKEKVTEIAFLYGYSSTSSFTRAFKKYFGILPSEVKKRKEVMTFPRIVFEKNIIEIKGIKYQISTINQIELYGKKCEIDDENYISQIYQFYNELEKNNLLQQFKKGIWYGITILEQEKEYYFVGSTNINPNLEYLNIPKTTCIISNQSFIKQNDIANNEIKMIHSLIPSTNYKKNNSSKLYEIEIYTKEECQIAIPIN